MRLLIEILVVVLCAAFSVVAFQFVRADHAWALVDQEKNWCFSYSGLMDMDRYQDRSRCRVFYDRYYPIEVQHYGWGYPYDYMECMALMRTQREKLPRDLQCRSVN